MSEQLALDMAEVRLDVPQGYKRTEIGVIPEDWEATYVGQVTSWLSGGTPNRKREDYWQGNIPWISGSTLKTLELETSDQFLTSEGVDAGSKMAPLDSTLLLVRGSALHSEIRAGLVVAPVCFNQDVKALIPNKNVVPRYLTIYLLAMEGELLKLVSSAGNSAGVLDTELVKNFKFLQPSKLEQTAIATALSDVDALINELEQLVAKKQAIKTATMQQLLTGRTRLPQFALRNDGSPKGYKASELGEIPEDWDVEKVGDMLYEISMGPFGSDIKASNFVRTGVPVLSGLNVSSEKLKDSFNNYVSPEKAKSLKKAVASRGDVIVTHRGTIGQISYVPQDSLFEKYVVSQSQFRARFQSKVLPSWVVTYFLSPRGSYSLLEGKGHTGVPAIAQATTTFRKLLFPLPPFSEQTAIASILSDMDSDISSLQQRLSKTRQIKQGMMQELLTGKTRLKT